ncbi:MAG TPA: hypothetical protein VKR61_24990 [Bryobacteraceae bacterium]|nr:hypothetical protein [Bryobacteraceae bacterium]
MRTVRRGLLALTLGTLAYAQSPAINAGGIVNTGNYATGGVAPGSIVSIFGTHLAEQVSVAGSIPLPTSLGNVTSVTFNGVKAGLYFVSSGQINAEVPWDVLPSGASSGTVNVVATTTGGASAPQSVQIVAANPGIFTTSANGLGQAITTDNNDGDISAATLSIQGLRTHPIHIGSYLIVWCTGLGAVDSTVPNGGNTGGKIVNTLIKPTVLIGGVQAGFVYSVLSPQFAGEYQIGVQVASNTPTGTDVSLQVQINGITTSKSVTVAVTSADTSPLSASCTLTSTTCTGITITGDPYSTTGGFSGYDDPTIRQDPQTGTLWMAYSYLHVISGATAGGGTHGIDTHVASSTDGGRTWIYQGALYTSQQVLNPITGQTDYTHHEVINLLPQVVNGVTYWYGIHSYYYVPVGSNGGGSTTESYTKRWEIAMAPGTATTGPMGLAAATPQYLGQPINVDPATFPVAIELNSLNSQLSPCNEYYEPALILSDNNLYLFLSCTPLAGTGSLFYAVFKTPDPQDHAGDWSWTYVPQGPVQFANHNDAVSVGSYLGGGATYITQMDLAPSSKPGVLLAIMTAAFNSGGKNSIGCVAAELASIDPPAFVYNAQGQVQVDAAITSSDSTPTGPDSCTYSPNSATGMIIAHRSDHAPENGAFFVLLMQSLLFP